MKIRNYIPMVGLLLCLSCQLQGAIVDWAGGGDGSSWNDPLNWSGNLLPGSDDDVTIDVAGGVTVIVTGSQTVKSLNNQEVLFLQGGALSGHAILTATNGAINAGSIVLGSGGGYTAKLAVSGGTLTNTATGLIEARDGNLATSFLDGAFYNLGAVVVQTNAFLVSNGTFQQAGGSMSGAGRFQQDSGLFSFTGGQVIDHVYVSGGALHVGAGVTAPSIVRAATPNSFFLGNESAVVTVSIEGGIYNHAILTATNSVVNAGSIVLSSGGGYTAKLAVSGGTLTNTATGLIEARDGNLATSFLDGAFYNLGAVVVQTNAFLVSNGTFQQAGGSMSGAGRFQQDSGLFSFTGGQVIDHVYVSGGALHVGAGVTAPSIVRAATPNSFFLGNESAVVTVSIEGGIYNHAILTATNSVVNAGSIVLSSGGGYTAKLAVSGGTLTNTATGLIEARDGNLATSFLDGAFYNLGAVVVQTNAFLVSNGTFQQAGGSMSGAGRFQQDSGLFSFTGGQVIDHVYVSGGALHVGAGVTAPSIVRAATPNSFFLGNESAVVTVSIEGGIYNHAILTATNSVVNAGSIVLSSGGGYTAKLAVSGGTLTNTATGLIEARDGNLATSFLDGAFYNLGAVVVQTNAFLVSNGTFQQAGGSMSGAGRFQQDSGLFSFTGGQVIDHVYVSGGALHVGAGVTAPSIVRAATPNSLFLGNESAAVTVSIEGGVYNHAILTATNNVVNAGSIVLSSVGGYTAKLAVSGGALTNTATGLIEARDGNLATSFLDGDFYNLGAVVVVTNAFLVSNGTFQQAGGSMGGAGRFQQDSGLFAFTGGQVTDHVYVSGGALQVGAGVTAPSIVRAATPNSLFLGNESAAVTVSIEGGVYNHAILTATNNAVNAGSIVLSSVGGYTAKLAVSGGMLTNTATGLIEARDGNLATSFLDGAFYNLGAVVVQANAFLVSKGTFQQVGGSMSGAGRFQQDSGLFAFTGGRVIDHVYVSGGALQVSAGVTAPSIVRAATPNSLFLGNESAAVTVSIEGGVYNHAILTATNSVVNAGSIVLSSGGGYTAKLAVSGGTLTNTGTGVIEARDGNLATSFLDGDFYNLGAVVVQANASLVSKGTLQNDVSGYITGSGTINASAASFTNAGTVSPGASPGILNFIGTYNQTGSGKLAIEIGGLNAGAGYGRIAVNGAANLNGQLKISLIDGFVPPFNSIFTILTATTRNGTFAGVSGPPQAFDLAYQLASVDLKTVGTAPTPPRIVTQPVSQAASEGESVIFSVGASGATPLSYQWEFNDVDILSETGQSLTLNNVQLAQAGNYSVRVSNVSGTAASTTASLAVVKCVNPPSGLIAWWDAEGTARDLSGTNHGTLQNTATFAPGKSGQAFNFDGVAGYVSTELDVQPTALPETTWEAWVYPARVINQFRQMILSTDDGGFDRSVLIEVDRGIPNFSVFNGSGHWEPVPPTFGEWQHIAVVFATDRIEFYKNGERFVLNGPFNSQITTRRLNIGRSPRPGEYFQGLVDEVAIFNRALTTNEIAGIYAAGSAGMCKDSSPPIIVTQPQSRDVFADNGVSFSVTVSGAEPLSYQWQMNGADLAGATNEMLTLLSVVPAQAGNYRVRVTNQTGSALSDPAVLRVVEPIQFVAQPQSQTMASGGSVTFSVTVSGTGPFVFQWRKNGVNLAGETNATLTIVNVQPDYGGAYSVAVDNGGGALNSQEAVLSVAVPVQPPGDNFVNRVLLSGPSGVVQGSNVGATKESGEPPHAGKVGGKSVWYRWVAPENGIVSVATRGSDFDTLLAVYTGSAVNALQREASDEDRGEFLTSALSFNAVAGREYEIAIDGFSGLDGRAAEGNFILSWKLEPTVEVLPVITQPPLSQTVAVGASVTLSVTANGGGLAYQWLFNGNPIIGATSATLLLGNVQLANVGTYQVRVANGSRAVVSLPADLQLDRRAVGLVAGRIVAADKLEDLPSATSGVAPQRVDRRLAAGGSGVPVLSHGVPVDWVFSNQGAQKESWEPNHCGEIGGASVWSVFVCQQNGTIEVSTAGSDFATVVAVYFREVDGRLVPVGCGAEAGGGQGASARFAGVAGTEYSVAVDGVGGATGTSVLRLSLVGPERLEAAGFVGRAFSLRLTGNAGNAYRLEATSDLVNWTPIWRRVLIGDSTDYLDTNAVGLTRRFYRWQREP